MSILRKAEEHTIVTSKVVERILRHRFPAGQPSFSTVTASIFCANPRCASSDRSLAISIGGAGAFNCHKCGHKGNSIGELFVFDGVDADKAAREMNTAFSLNLVMPSTIRKELEAKAAARAKVKRAQEQAEADAKAAQLELEIRATKERLAQLKSAATV